MKTTFCWFIAGCRYFLGLWPSADPMFPVDVAEITHENFYLLEIHVLKYKADLLLVERTIVTNQKTFSFSACSSG